MNSTTARVQDRTIIYLFVYSLAGLILFAPVINKYFVSDDFLVLKRVCLDREFRIHGFFRPLSDLTLYGNYLLGGFNPVGFNLFSILLHSFNSYLLFKFCSKWNWTSDRRLQRSYAIMASLLFLTYPFHNESIVWALGRGSSMAATFALGAMVIFVSGWSKKIMMPAICGCYFIGLLAYESIIMLPVIILIMLPRSRANLSNYLSWALAFFITIVIHLSVRYNISGAVFGSYGDDLLHAPWISYPGNILKVFARLIVPPINSSTIFLAVAIGLAFFVSAGSFFTFIKIRNSRSVANFALMTFGILVCALIVPVLFAVSTKTSESDRLLYFPSFFLCCLISFVLHHLISSHIKRQSLIILICACNIIFLELNNVNWARAGNATYSLLKALKSDTGFNKIYVANLPGEIEGAYVFRLGFKEALMINKIDTSQVIVINQLSKELTKAPGTFKPEFYGSKIFIPPFLEIETGQGNNVANKPGFIQFRLPDGSKLFYWDQQQFKALDQSLLYE